MFLASPRTIPALLLLAMLACGGGKAGETETTTTGDTESSATDSTATDSDTDDTDTGSIGPVDCEIDSCIYCRALDSEAPPPTPYCTNLLHVCDLPTPCETVVFSGSGDTLAVDVDVAHCALEALRDGGPAALLIDVGEFDKREILLPGGGIAMVQWDFGFGNYLGSVRSGLFELQPASYFEACLAETEAKALSDCFGIMQFDCPEPGWTPPFTTGTCTFGGAAEGCSLGD